jgi:periplasmic copper chaperone A
VRCWALALYAVSTLAAAQVEVQDAWTRATAPGSKIAAGYMTLRNAGASPDRLLGAMSPLAERVEMHVHIKDGDVVRMRQVKAYDIPPKGTFELKPGSAHLMFIGVKQPFKEGEKVPTTLRFEHAGAVNVEFRVGGLGDTTSHKGH